MSPAAIFVNPVQLAIDECLWLILPLLVSVSVIYRTVRTHNLRRVHFEALGLLTYMIVGLALLGLGLWALWALLP